MNLKHIFWHFPNALTNKFCQEVLDFSSKQESRLGVTGVVGNDRDPKKDPLSKEETQDVMKKRKSEIVWLNEPWIYKEITPFIDMANKSANWNFDWDYSEEIQFTKYSKGQYYGWHRDSFFEPYTEKNGKQRAGKTRKLSVTCQLSDPNDYEGGDLEFANLNDDMKLEVYKAEKQKGSVTVFPSFVYHRVAPINKGTRYSLVVWNLGVPFK